jgi:hypothetical protein
MGRRPDGLDSMSGGQAKFVGKPVGGGFWPEPGPAEFLQPPPHPDVVFGRQAEGDVNRSPPVSLPHEDRVLGLLKS